MPEASASAPASQEVTIAPPPTSTPATANSQAVAANKGPATTVEDEEDLREGYVAFSGMVRPVKGGYEVRGVVLDDALFVKRLEASSLDGKPTDREWFLGAVVKVTAELKRVDTQPPNNSGLAEQRSEGPSWRVVSLDIVELIKHAVVVEGTLARSKGFFSLDRYLINRHDLAWALASSGEAKDGDKVKLWGQPFTVRCEPGAQCLSTGSLPLFRIGRAKKLP